jgi:hypothetical protein
MRHGGSGVDKPMTCDLFNCLLIATLPRASTALLQRAPHRATQIVPASQIIVPAFYGINCAKVEMSSYHLIQQERPQ